jgi:hypothetical protein
MSCNRWKWDQFVESGKISFDYLYNNFHDMIDGDIIKHFELRHVSPDTIDYLDDINKKYGNDIHKKVVPWIKNEFDSGSLLENNNWKPFRDRYHLIQSYLGYKKLFQYKNYYFQLAIDNSLWYPCEDCKYCDNDEKLIHFELALYGIKDDNYEKLQPDNKVVVGDDNMMPAYDWNFED